MGMGRIGGPTVASTAASGSAIERMDTASYPMPLATSCTTASSRTTRSMARAHRCCLMAGGTVAAGRMASSTEMGSLQPLITKSAAENGTTVSEFCGSLKGNLERKINK